MMKFLSLLALVFSFQIFAESILEISNQEALTRLKKVLSKQQGPYCERQIHRVGNKTVQFEAFISMEADAKLGPAILGNFKNFPNWITKNINQKPSGGTYYVKVQELKLDPKETSRMHGFFNIDVPVFKSTLHALFNLASEEKDGVFTLKGKMEQDPNSILENAEAVLKTFPTEKPSAYRWIYVASHVQIRNWLLYEAFPERLLKRESGERIQIVLDNYQSEEDRLRSN